MNVSDYLDSVLQIVRTNERPSGLKASTLGLLIIRSLPGERWTKFGFPTLKSLLQQLEQRGVVRLGDDAQGAFAVWPASALKPGPLPTPMPTPPPSQKYNPLRRDFWLAFAAASTLGRRFASRTTGAVRMGLAERPHPADQWIEITPISDEVQKGWAKQFLVEKGRQEPHLLAALDAPTWFVQFVQALRHCDPELTWQWNRTRSEKVSGVVRRWLEEHKLEPEIAFVQQPQPSYLRSIARTSKDETRARDAVLGALSRMTTDELAELPIPAKYLLKELGL